MRRIRRDFFKLCANAALWLAVFFSVLGLT
jgi:hypothetical protein